MNSYPLDLQSVKGWLSPPVRLNPSSEQFGLETCRRAPFGSEPQGRRHVESLTAERLKIEDSRRSPSTPPFGLPSAMRHVDELMSSRSLPKGSGSKTQDKLCSPSMGTPFSQHGKPGSFNNVINKNKYLSTKPQKLVCFLEEAKFCLIFQNLAG